MLPAFWHPARMTPALSLRFAGDTVRDRVTGPTRVQRAKSRPWARARMGPDAGAAHTWPRSSRDPAGGRRRPGEAVRFLPSRITISRWLGEGQVPQVPALGFASIKSWTDLTVA